MLQIVERGMRDAAPGRPVELLLADNDESHLRRVADRAPDGHAPGCSVDTPEDCPAVRQGAPLVFDSSEELDACPKLRGRPYGPCAATCVPVAVMGRAVGVLHAIRPDDDPERPHNTERLRSLAARTGARIEMVRVLADSQLQAATDPLTGLINRRSLETHFRELPRDARPVTVAMCDLDHFKDLNDTHGHETGDRALRQFARVLSAALRPGDVAARFGGEEFVLLLPRCSADTARQVVQRVRERLADSLEGGLLPTFTVSIGLADSSMGDDLQGWSPPPTWLSTRRSRRAATASSSTPRTGPPSHPACERSAERPSAERYSCVHGGHSTMLRGPRVVSNTTDQLSLVGCSSPHRVHDQSPTMVRPGSRNSVMSRTRRRPGASIPC